MIISFLSNRHFDEEPYPFYHKDEMERQKQIEVDNEHALSVLHAAYPAAPLSEINQAVMTDWDWSESDERNILTCKYLEVYV